MPASRAKQAETAGRRADLIRLRRAGRSFDSIAAELGYASRQAASKDFIRAIEQRRDEQAAEVSVYRQEMNERLDALLEAAWPDATIGDPKAIETVLKVLDRQAKLNGLDAPVKSELSGPDGGSIPLGGTLAELTSLINTAGDTDTTSDGDEGDDGDH